MIIAVVVLVAITTGILNRGVGTTKQDSSLARSVLDSKVTQISADAGVEDVSYRVRTARRYDPTESLSLNNTTIDTTVSNDALTGIKTVLTNASLAGVIRRTSASYSKDSKVSFSYAVQAGPGGVNFNNSSSIVGNIYSAGPVSGTGNIVSGSIISTGPTGFINNMQTGSDARAHTIQSTTVGGNAYYTNIIGGSVAGTKYPGSPDPLTLAMPITDSEVALWEAAAAAGTTYNSPCPYVINTTRSIGPAVITCDLNISGNIVLTLLGPVWVKGNITMSNSGQVKIGSAVGKSVAVIADNPADHTLSSKIIINNNFSFTGLASPKSYILLVAMASTSPAGVVNLAIDVSNSPTGDFALYSPKGETKLANSALVTSVAAMMITLKNSAQLSYQEGVASMLFDSGPGGSWDLSSWAEAL